MKKNFFTVSVIVSVLYFLGIEACSSDEETPVKEDVPKDSLVQEGENCFVELSDTIRCFTGQVINPNCLETYEPDTIPPITDYALLVLVDVPTGIDKDVNYGMPFLNSTVIVYKKNMDDQIFEDGQIMDFKIKRFRRANVLYMMNQMPPFFCEIEPCD